MADDENVAVVRCLISRGTNGSSERAFETDALSSDSQPAAPITRTPTKLSCPADANRGNRHAHADADADADAVSSFRWDCCSRFGDDGLLLSYNVNYHCTHVFEACYLELVCDSILFYSSVAKACVRQEARQYVCLMSRFKMTSYYGGDRQTAKPASHLRTTPPFTRSPTH